MSRLFHYARYVNAAENECSQYVQNWANFNRVKYDKSDSKF